MRNKLLIVGPSKDIRQFDSNYFEDKRKQGYQVVSFSNSLSRFIELGIQPDYWSFFDPFTLSYYFEDFKTVNLKDTKLLTLDLYGGDYLAEMRKIGFVLRNLKQDTSFEGKYKDLVLEDVFKEHIKIGFELVTRKEAPGLRNYYDKNIFHLLKPAYSNYCKLTSFVIPLVYNYFKDISDITLIGFGHFEGRFIDKNNSKGTPDYKQWFTQMKVKLKSFLNESNTNIRFEGSPSYYEYLKTENE